MTRVAGAKDKLNWGVRYKIAVGTSEGLFYLHEGCQRRIIHKDIKAANILLTEDFEPQVRVIILAFPAQQAKVLLCSIGNLICSRYLISGLRSGSRSNGLIMWFQK